MKQEISRLQGETHPQTTTLDHHFSVQLSATRRGARLARLLATEQLRSWGLPFEDAAHVIAELAANAALHGRVPGRDFRLTLTADAKTLRIEVRDAQGDQLPVTDGHAPRRDQESDRGLLLVEALADRWGVTPGPPPCKTVWAELDHRPRPARIREASEQLRDLEAAGQWDEDAFLRSRAARVGPTGDGTGTPSRMK